MSERRLQSGSQRLRGVYARGRLPILFMSAPVFALSLAAGPAWATCLDGVDRSTPDAQMIDNGNETITDSLTGLMWKQCTEGSSGVNCLTGVPPFVNFAQAQAFAAAANTANFAGHNDWRLPNLKELESLVETACQQPSINETRFPATQNSYYWSSTNYELFPSRAWTVFFYAGVAASDDKTATKYVRLVRAGNSFAAFDSTAAGATAASGPSPTGSGQINAGIQGGGPSCGFANAEFVQPTATPPPGVSFPHGLFDFTVYSCLPGGTVVVTVTYPAPLPTGTNFWKYGPTAANPTAHWYILPATITGNIVQFSVTDGGLGDGDLTLNGRITDPSGPDERLFADGFE